MTRISEDGVWWTPDAPEVQWFGTVRFGERVGTSLTIITPVDRPDFAPALQVYPIIWGRGSSGQPYTLIDCHDQSTRASLFGVPRRVRISASRLIVGFYAADGDPALMAVAASFRNLDEWHGRSGIDADPAVAWPNFAPRYTASSPLLLYDAEGFRVQLRSSARTSMGRLRASIRQHVSFEIATENPTPLGEFESLVRACGDFVSLAASTLCDMRRLTVKPPQDSDRIRIGSYHATSILKPQETRVSPESMLFRLGDIHARAPALFHHWLSNRSKLFDSRVLYFSAVYGRGFLEHRLLQLTQAAEAFHRRFCEDRYMPSGEFEKILTALSASAVQTVNDKALRASILQRLVFANEYSLRKRLRVLFAEHHEVLSLLVARPKTYVDPIVDTRNKFTHFPIAAEESPGRADAGHRESVFQYNWILRLLLEACFLRTMGFANEEIVELVRRSDTYRQMAQRFAGAGV